MKRNLVTKTKIMLWLLFCFILPVFALDKFEIPELSKKYSSSFPMKLEAENAEYTDLTLLGESGASNNGYLRMGESGSVKWIFAINDGGWYKIKIGYKNSGGDSENYFNKNDVSWKIGLGWSGNWTTHEKLVALSTGNNSIEIAADHGNVDIDYLLIDTLTVDPKLTPVNNNFYLKSPRDIVVKMNAYGRNISHLTANGSALDYTTSIYPYEEDAWLVRISRSSLSSMLEGQYEITIHFDSGENASLNVTILGDTIASLVTIIAPYISHGNSVLILLPTGKTLLIDCGSETWRDQVVIPLLQKHGVSKLDYFFLTHYHEDHDAGDGGETIKLLFDVEHFYDYKDFSAGDILELQSIRIKILNAYTGGTNENQNSLSFKLDYKGFIYIHGADIYGTNQQAIMNQFPADVKGHVYSANHHFHGSADFTYMRAMDPYLVFVQSEQAIYARSAES